MTVRAILIACATAAAMAAVTAGSAPAGTLGYRFGGPEPVTCRAGHTNEWDIGGWDTRYCADTESFDPVGGGLPVDITAMPSIGGPDGDPYGGLNVLGAGIGVGSKGDKQPYGPSPGGSKVSRGITPARPDTLEMLKLSWGGTPVQLTTLAVRSYTPMQQQLRIVSGDDGRILDSFNFAGGSRGLVTTYVFETPLWASSFLLEPRFTVEGMDGGFLLVGADIIPTPVPPALPLLGGAAAYLFWRARRAKAV